MGALLRPIATPLVMSGMDAATSDLVTSMFRDAGFTPMLSGGAGGDRRRSETGAAASGRSDRRRRSSAATARWAPPAPSPISTAIALYAFGHPFFNFGPTAFPMTRAHGLRVAAQPDVVLQDRHDGRRRRDDAAGSRDGDRGHARQGARR